MSTDGGKNWGNLSISDGGQAERGERRTHADIELERAARALFVAMCGKDGKAINKNFRNVARGHVSPLRILIRRLKEAKLARAPRAYEHSKGLVREIDKYVDRLYGRRNDTGDFPRVA